MIKTQRPYFFFNINSRPVQKFKGTKTYVSTGDSEDMENGELVTFYNRPSKANVEPKVNDVIFAKMANTNKTFLINEKLASYIFSTGFFDISSKYFEPRYLTYLVKSDEFDGYKNAYSEGTTQVSISDKRLKKICVTYEADIQKQKQIADILDIKVKKIDDLISNLQEQNKNLGLLFLSKINSLILPANAPKSNNSFIPRVTHSSIICKFNIFIKKVKDGTHSSFGRVNGSGYYLLSAKNVLNDKLMITDSESEISKKDFLSIVKCGFPKKNDVLFTTVGSIGRTLVYNEDSPNAFQRSVFFIRPPKNINSQYLSYFFRSKYFKDQLSLYVKQTAQSGIYAEDFKRIYLLIPTLEDQKTIVEKISNVSKQVNHCTEINNRKIKELLEYKKSLIYEYVSGKKEVSL